LEKGIDRHMITQVRLARPSIILNGQDFYSTLAPYLLSLEYTDNSDGERADDLNLQLADRDRRFINDWMPEPGVFLDVTINCERWFALNAATLSLDCGRFWIDTIDFELPQHTVSVKASSIPTDVHIKDGDETRGWEGSSLQDIANQIAGENDMEVDWQSDVNPKYKRVEQTEESGLCFLKKRARDCGLSIKCHKNKLVFFEESKLEEAEPSFTLAYGNTAGTYRMTGGHFSLRTTDKQKSETVSHVNPETGRLTEEKFETGDEDMSDRSWDQKKALDPDYEPDQTGEGGSQLIVPRDVPVDPSLQGTWRKDDPSDNAGKGAGGKSAGQRKAKADCREKNKDKESATIALSIGNPLIAAGQTFLLKGVGQFDGKWFIESARHSIGNSAYETSLGVRRCLEGY
jgi:Bacteriophage probable baseplate hub protein